ncbi:Bax inhibitor-1/YccA family protein [Brevibacterium samyangense]|uniref:Bax inhibitor-1/YccA family protein n=1 Tax=Brevibacterium samyangense TaxID=366888 RepID=A0ABN2T4E3_9MICO
MSNPIVNRSLKQGVQAARTQAPAAVSADQLQQMYDAPAARPMTIDDVLMKTVISFGVLLLGAVVGWFVPMLALPAVIVALVIGLVIAFKREPSKGLVLAYSGIEGIALGGISGIFNAIYPGIVTQAVLATLSVFAVCFALYKFRIVRVSSGFMKFLMFAVAGYAVFSIVNFVFSLATGTSGARGIDITIMGVTMPLGILISGVAVILAALTLITDFQSIEAGIRQRVPEKYSWLFAFSLMTSLVWLYIEILRILSYLRGGD